MQVIFYYIIIITNKGITNMTYQTKKKNFIKSLNNNMNLVEDSANLVGWSVDAIREAYIQMFIRDENVTVQQIHDDKLWMCA